MFKNYLTVAIRNLFRHWLYSVVNVLGLAVGFACCMLIGLYVQYELSYDKHHTQADRIYRILRETRSEGGESTLRPWTSSQLGNRLQTDFPEVQQRVRLRYRESGVWMSSEDKKFRQRFCWADEEILDVFSFPLMKGDRETVFKDPFSIVITEEMAEKFFGNADPIGKIFVSEGLFYDGTFTVTGVLKNIPKNSSLRFDFLTSRQSAGKTWDKWIPTKSYRPYQNYILLPEGYTPQMLEAKLPEFMARYMGERVAQLNTYRLQQFSRMHLYAGIDFAQPNWDRMGPIYLFVTVAFFVLVIACINFVNLTTARSANRIKEVGMRKVVGAQRYQLICQFLGEAVLQACLALVLAISLAIAILPAFSTFTDQDLVLDNNMVFGICLFTVGIGILAGGYPALVLSGGHPMRVFQGGLRASPKGRMLRKALVVFQFAVSVVLIVGMLVVDAQMTYVQTKHLGFNRDQIVILPLFTEDPNFSNERTLKKRYQTVKDAFLQHPNVLRASATINQVNGASGRLTFVRPQGQTPGEWMMFSVDVDEDFLDTYEIDVVSGRGFSREIPSDYKNAILLNETAVKMLGWTDPIGKTFTSRNRRNGQVIGVVKDFHIRSLREEVAPVFLSLRPTYANVLSLKISPENLHALRIKRKAPLVKHF